MLIFAPLRFHYPAGAIDKVPAVIDEYIFALLIVILEGVLVIGQFLFQGSQLAVPRLFLSGFVR